MERLREQLHTEFAQDVLLKTKPDNLVQRVRRLSDNRQFVFRQYRGDGAVYQRLLTVECPYLPKVEAVKVEGDTVLVLEEYIQGDSLDELLQAGVLSSEETARFGTQLCAALEVLHGLGAVHRDIKPENIIIRGSDAVLIDFDASRIVKQAHTADTRVLGTTGFAAPEQYGFFQTDARADIYSMGVLLNVMLTGQHPSKTLARGDLRTVIETCTRINVDSRYPSAQALAQALAEKPAVRRRRIGSAAAILAAVLAGALLGGGLMYGSRQLLPEQETPAAVVGEALRAEDLAKDPADERLQQALEQYRTIPQEYGMDFSYDLDGDGLAEQYRFGMYMNVGQHGLEPGIMEWDSLYFRDDGTNLRFAAPAVFRLEENGSYVPEPAFAALLEDPQTLLYAVEFQGEERPLVWREADYEGWSGAVGMLQCRENKGLWLFEATAVLDGQTLTACTVCHIDRQED